MLHTQIEVLLSQLSHSEEPVRTTPALEEAHQELVASIRSHGLLHNLLVDETPHGYIVLAGNRRLEALLDVYPNGHEHIMIPCNLLGKGIDQEEAALAENTARVAMHPAEAAVVYSRLIAKGSTLEQLADRFGVDVRNVRKHLRLANLHPTILESYQKGDIRQETAMAYATTEDTERQIEIYQALENGSCDYSAGDVLRALEQEKIRSTSTEVEFVGLDAYREAGGAVEETLFTDYAVLTDVDLLNRLIDEKLQEAADKIRGWKWVTVNRRTENYEISRSYTQLDKRLPDFTEEEQAVIDEYDELQSKIWRHESTDEEQTRIKELTPQHDGILQRQRKRRRWHKEQKEVAGVVVTLGYDGKIKRYEGLVKKGDQVPAKDKKIIAQRSGRSYREPAAPREIPEKVENAIRTLRTTVIRHCLRSKPELALDVLIFHFMLQLAENPWQERTPLMWNLDYSDQKHLQPEVDGAGELLKKHITHPEWGAQVLAVLESESPAEGFRVFRKLSRKTKTAVAAEIAARSLLESSPSSQHDVHDAVEHELNINYSLTLASFDPLTWNSPMFWGRLRKDKIIELATPFLGEEWAKGAVQMKKKALAEDTAKRMINHGPDFLPPGFTQDGEAE